MPSIPPSRSVCPVGLDVMESYGHGFAGLALNILMDSLGETRITLVWWYSDRDDYLMWLEQ